MKFLRSLGFAIATVALFLPSVLSQALPTCAAQCLQTSLKAQNTCSATDLHCICTTPALLNTVQGCVLSACTIIQALSAQNTTQNMCGAPIRDRSHIAPTITYATVSIALVAVVLRCIARADRFALDDIFAVVAFTTGLPQAIITVLMSKKGFGKDIWTLSAENITWILKYGWLTEMAYIASLTFIKASFLCFCLRIFPGQRLRVTLYTLLAVTMVAGLVFLIVDIFSCTPVSGFWEAWDGEHKAKCINFNAFAWSFSGFEILLDVIIIAVPIPAILSLSLGLKEKLRILSMFTVGLATTVISIIRLHAIIQFATYNQTYDNVSAAYWSILEVFIGIFCICMPAMHRFFSKLFPQYFSSTKKASSYQQCNAPKNRSDDIAKGPRARYSTTQASSISKNTDTKVEIRRGEEDEVELCSLAKES